jgi:hypothetical protein
MLEKIKPYLPLPRNSESGSPNRSEPDSSPDLCSPSAAAFWTERLMKNYITAKRLDDPKSYVANVATVLMHYPESIAQRTADPFKGIVSRQADTRLLLTPPTASPEERERAFQRWMRDIRPELETPPLTPRRREKTLAEVLADDTPLPALGEYARMTRSERAEKVLARRE